MKACHTTAILKLQFGCRFVRRDGLNDDGTDDDKEAIAPAAREAPDRPESVESLPGGGLLARWTSANGREMRTMKLAAPSVGSAAAAPQTNRERAQLIESVAHIASTPRNEPVDSDAAKADRFALFQKLVSRPYFGESFQRLAVAFDPLRLSVTDQLDLFQLLRYVHAVRAHTLVWLHAACAGTRVLL